MSIDIDALLRDGMALWGFTLTIAETPSSPEAWAGIREKWFKRVDRRLPGCRWVWITEFQRRGTPHLHGVLVAPANVGDTVRQLCYGDWPEVASAAGERKTLARAQYVTEIYSASGWLQYLTKHLQRGPNHYQRNRLPDGWDKSGRIYGYNRGWITSESKLMLSNVGWYQLRRLINAWAWAETAKLSLPDKIRARRYLRRRRRAGGRESSAFIGGSEWMPPAVQQQLLDWIIDQGYIVLNGETGEVFNSPIP